MVRKILFTLVTALTILSLFSTAAPASAAPARQTGSCSSTLYYPTGQGFLVSPTAAANANGPVVVFVHGYLNNHLIWNVGNDAVYDACANGFRVAAVDLNPVGSIWDNAAALQGKLQAIARYYGVARVNVIAHSKGGLDTQTAIVHSGAHAQVQSYIALGSPYGGTDLADHACAWYGWALWQCNDATWTMRTGYMSYVRAITDGRAENDSVRAYVGRGNGCDWWSPTCLMIGGADDGIVPSWSVWANARATRISDRDDLNHLEVAQTQSYDAPWLFSHLSRARLQADGAQEVVAPLFARSDYTLRGGEVVGQVGDTITVEGGLDGVRFSLLATAPVRVTVISPSGKRYEAKGEATAPDAILRGVVYQVAASKPEAGLWQVVVAERNEGEGAHPGYLLHVSYEGGVSIQLDADLRQVYAPGDALPLALTPSVAVSELGARAALRDEQHALVAQGLAGEKGQPLVLPARSGTYNIDLHVTGVTSDGSPFERTLVTSIAAVELASLKEPASIR